MSSSPAPLILIDAHVHLHACFDPVPFLDAAYANFTRIARRSFQGRPFVGVMLLTDVPAEEGFERLTAFGEAQKAASGGHGGGWQACETGEAESIGFRAGDGKQLVVVAGRQLVTRERLEVLALGTRTALEEGAPMEQLIKRVAEEGALPVVPWGFGKWVGARGKLVERLVRTADLPPFFLGDNGNRPVFWPPSPLLREAEEKGIRNLQGSDPLPFASECRRPGSFGIMLEGPLPEDAPARYLKERLLDPSVAIRPFGNAEPPFRAIRNQVRMQVYMRRHQD